MDWQIRSRIPPKLEGKDRLEFILDQLYRHRQLETDEQRQQFTTDSALKPNQIISSLTDLDFSQLKCAVNVLKEAIITKRPIIVYGDYDVDGVCATAILWETLHQLGAAALPFIPHRLNHGYGLSEKGIASALTLFPDNLDLKPLLITVDNGIRAHAAAELLKQHGIDLIITDHHQSADRLPEAIAIVHTTSLCGAGVSWLLASQLTENVDPSLVALATVCDQLPLTGANRQLVRSGLRSLRQTHRPGLLALYRLAQIADPSLIDTYHLGFLIGPRLNAAGRLGHALDALRLLCTPNPSQAEKLAYQLDQQNQSRQELTSDFYQPALDHFQQLKALPNLLFYASPGCPEGIIGLLASKLTEYFNRPSIVFSTGQLIAKGSARSLNQINITEVLSQVSAHLIDFGGHELAAGMTVAQDQLARLEQALSRATAHLQPADFHKSLTIEVEIDSDDIGPELFRRLESLAPFGLGNPKPIFAATFTDVKLSLVGAQQNHLRLVMGGRGLTGIAFQLGSRFPSLNQGQPLQLAFSLEENLFRGRTSLQLVVKDLRPASR